MSDGLSDAHDEERRVDKLDRAIHILEEALTEFHDPMFGLNRQAVALVDEAMKRAKTGCDRCTGDCYGLDGRR